MVNHPLRCRCGTLQGQVAVTPAATHAMCYCRDCQAYARFIGTPGVADAEGGTEVVATLPKHVRFTSGLDALACVSLGPRGLLRWYAACCRTPIGNTPRDPRIAYVGLVHSCLGHANAIAAAFGPLRIKVNTASARGRVASTPVAAAASVLKLATSLLYARVTGAYRANPFFAVDERAPVRAVAVLTAAEREQAYRAD